MASPAVANGPAPNGMNTEEVGWKFAQCFGDKEEVEEVTEGSLERCLRVMMICSSNATMFISLSSFDYSAQPTLFLQ